MIKIQELNNKILNARKLEFDATDELKITVIKDFNKIIDFLVNKMKFNISEGYDDLLRLDKCYSEPRPKEIVLSMSTPTLTGEILIKSASLTINHFIGTVGSIYITLMIVDYTKTMTTKDDFNTYNKKIDLDVYDNTKNDVQKELFQFINKHLKKEIRHIKIKKII